MLALGTLLLGVVAASHPEAPLAGSTKAADITFSDPAGDATNGAPDLTSVRVGDRSGVVTFVVPVPGVPAPETRVEIYVDGDRNPATGASNGAEFALVLDTENLSRAWWRWDGSIWAHVTPSSAVSGFQSGVWTTSINVSDLGGTQSFRFYVLSIRFRDEKVFGSDVTTYNSYALGQQPPPPPPPPPPSPPPQNRVAITTLKKTPARPLAGQSFTVAATVKRIGRTGRFNGNLGCKAEIKGMREPRWFGSIRPGRATCRWEIPASAAGRTITGSLAVHENGPVATRRFSARIARFTTQLSAVGVSMSPKRGPEAGKQFYYDLGVTIRTGSGSARRISSGTVSCTAAIAGKALRVFQRGHVRPQIGVRCGWEVPHGTSGQTMVGSVIVKSESGTLRHSFKRRVG